MFNDEEPITFKKMLDFSPVDGFVEINENLADMIKFVANEPSVGLFYVQQHTQNAVPNLLNLKNKIAEKSHETALHTEDLEDSMTMLSSMKECGFSVADEMIRDIKKSLSIMSTKQPKRGLLYNSSSSFLARTGSWGRNAVFPQQDGDGSAGYLSSALKSVKQRASSLSRSQSSTEETSRSKNEKLPSESEDRPLPDEESHMSKSLSQQKLLDLYEHYDEFKADREAKLEEWLGGRDGKDHGEEKKMDKESD